MIRGIRGATTVTSNTEVEILDRTEELIKEMVQENKVEPADIASIIISVTEDVNAVFPAKALRRLIGFTFVPVMCVSEIPVPGSLPLCIRIMMTVNTTVAPHEVKHIYHHDAIVLRPDLQLTNKTEL